MRLPPSACNSVMTSTSPPPQATSSPRLVSARSVPGALSVVFSVFSTRKILNVLPSELRRCNGPRNQPAHVVNHILPALAPVDRAHRLAEHRRIRRFAFLLRRSSRRARFNRARRVAGKLCRYVRQALHQLARRLHGIDRRSADFNDIALVHAGGQIHCRHARFACSGSESTTAPDLHRAAPAECLRAC